MTEHRRIQLRRSVIDRLKAAGLAGGRVFSSRATPLPPEKLPAIEVRVETEALAAQGAPAWPLFLATETLIVEPIVKDEADAADRLDALCQQIEDLLLTDPSWVNQFQKVAQIGTTIAISGEGDRVTMSAQMSFGIELGRLSFEPKVTDTLTRISTGIDAIDPSDPNRRTPGPDGRIEVSLDTTLPT